MGFNQGHAIRKSIGDVTELHFRKAMARTHLGATWREPFVVLQPTIIDSYCSDLELNVRSECVLFGRGEHLEVENEAPFRYFAWHDHIDATLCASALIKSSRSSIRLAADPSLDLWVYAESGSFNGYRLDGDTIIHLPSPNPEGTVSVVGKELEIDYGVYM